MVTRNDRLLLSLLLLLVIVAVAVAVAVAAAVAVAVAAAVGTLRYEDGKARTRTAVTSCYQIETKCLRCVFSYRTATSIMLYKSTLQNQ